MCTVCDVENINSEFRNGEKKGQVTKFHRVYIGQVATLNLCYLHAVELFCIGETRFLTKHLKLAQELFANKKKYVQSGALF